MSAPQPQQQYSDLVNLLVTTQRDSLAAHKELVESHRNRLRELDALTVQLRLKNDNTVQKLNDVESRNTQLQRQVDRLTTELEQLKSSQITPQVLVDASSSSETSDVSNADASNADNM